MQRLKWHCHVKNAAGTLYNYKQRLKVLQQNAAAVAVLQICLATYRLVHMVRD